MHNNCFDIMQNKSPNLNRLKIDSSVVNNLAISNLRVTTTNYIILVQIIIFKHHISHGT